MSEQLNDERAAYDEWAKARPWVEFSDYAWQAWQARAALTTAARAAEPEGWKLVKVERLNDIAKYAADPSKECYLGRNLYDDRAVQDNWRACQSNLETIADEVRAIIEDWDKDELQEALAASPTPPTGTSKEGGEAA